MCFKKTREGERAPKSHKLEGRRKRRRLKHRANSVSSGELLPLESFPAGEKRSGSGVLLFVPSLRRVGPLE